MKQVNQRPSSSRRSVKGFTLTEMIVVIAIIGILLGVLMPTMSTWYWKSRVRSANSMAKMTYNSAQSEVQRYLAEDRQFTDPDDRSVFRNVIMIRYDRATGNAQFRGIGDSTWEVATQPEIINVVQRVNRTVSNASEYNWAVYIDTYIVKSSVAAESTATDNIGFYTKGSITIDKTHGVNYNDVCRDWLVEKATTVYDATESSS